MSVSEIMPRSPASICPAKTTSEYAQTSRLFADRVLAVANAVCLAISAALVLGLFVFYLRQSGKALYFTPYSLLEEAAYTFISANNYLRFGYLNSGFLQDFSTSLNPADHPYVYNHMPPGPDLLTSALLSLFSGNYVLVRAFFACMMFVGLGVYFLFARMLLRNLGVRFSGIVVLFLSPWVIIQLFDRQIYSPFPLLAFLPLLLVSYFLKTSNRFYLAGALPTIFLSAIYIEYSLLSAIILCWTMLYFTQLMPLRFRHMVVIGVAFGAGIGAHLIQNMLFLGWDNFVLELKSTISNRVTGFPTQEELKDFYQRLGIVHHGSHPIEPGALLSQIRANFSVPVTLSATLMLFSCVLWIFSARRARFGERDPMSQFVWSAVITDLALLGRLIVWMVITILAPIILFPAFAQEVNLRGVGNVFFLAIPLAFISGYGLWILAYAGHRAASVLINPAGADGRAQADISEPGPALAKLGVIVCRVIALIGIWIACMDGCLALFNNTKSEVFHIQRISQDPMRWSLLYDIRRFDGELFMTNINVPTVGFLVTAPGFGVCGPDSVAQDGQLNLNECKTSFMRRHEYWLTQQPRYFFYFLLPELFPGFADCMPAGLLIGTERGGSECMQRLSDTLASQYPLVMKNSIVSVFDLGKKSLERKGN